MLSRQFVSEYEKRQRQINTLKIFNDNVNEIAEGSEYSIVFQSGNHELSLFILLPSDFPNELPILKITPIVAHSWVDSEGYVKSAPGLLNFTIHSDLGRVVQAITREFERNPPPLASDCYQKSIISQQNEGRGRLSPVINFTYQIPTASQSLVFPDLNSLTNEELELLNENLDIQDEFLDNEPQLRAINKAVDDLITKTEELACRSLSQKELLESEQTALKAKREAIGKLLEKHDILLHSYEQLSNKYKPQNIKVKLRNSIADVDEESEAIAQNFLSGNLDLDQFLSSYNKLRTLSHKRKAKEERLAHQLNELEKAGF